jgi:hypothetical protein
LLIQAPFRRILVSGSGIYVSTATMLQWLSDVVDVGGARRADPISAAWNITAPPDPGLFHRGSRLIARGLFLPDPAPDSAPLPTSNGPREHPSELTSRRARRPTGLHLDFRLQLRSKITMPRFPPGEAGATGIAGGSTLGLPCGGNVGTYTYVVPKSGASVPLPRALGVRSRPIPLLPWLARA